jgi:YfiH family protein
MGMAALIEPEPHSIAGHGLALHDGARLVFGFTDAGFPAPALKRLFPSLPLLFLKQVHSGRIVSDSEWHAGVEADGLLLERPGVVAVVQTADCMPLFFFNERRSSGGILHVGWRGLQQGIEEKLAERLGSGLGDYHFYLGPAIEKKCYEVGPELPGLFTKKSYVKGLFSVKGDDKQLMDLKGGLKLSLAALGVASGRIQDSGLCTFCSGGRFPSYRRDGKTGRRIFNFLLLK